MSFLGRLAVRNLLRHRRRSLLSLVAIIAGVAVLVVGRGFLAGLTENFVRSQIDAASGHVMARPAGYPTDRLAHPVDHAYRLDEDDRGWLETHSAAWTARLIFAPQLAHGPDAIRVRAIGFDPERDVAVFPRDTWKLAGTIPGGLDDGVLVSSGVARLLEVGPGDDLVLQTRTVKGAINALSTKVAGVLSTANPYIDRFGVLVPLPLADSLVDARGRVTHVSMRLPRRSRAASEDMAAQLAAQLGEEVETTTWYAETEDMREIQETRQIALDLLVFALLGISATGIANTVLMAAYERIREIGTLRAMGMTRGDVTRLFLMEGAIMGLVGAVIGCLLGSAVVLYFRTYGIDLSPALDRGAGGHIPVSTVLYLALDPLWVGIAFLFGVGTSILASLWPARIAAAMQPADAVRAT